MSYPPAYDKARAVFARHGGLLRTSEALKAGIHPRTLYGLRDAGTLIELTRGTYRLADLPPLGAPDLVAVTSRIPNGVICLLSALAHHRLTTQIPHAIQIALARGERSPQLAHPPLEVFHFSGRSFATGIEKVPLDGITVRIYSPEKSIADLFKYRNKLGLDVALEALRLYRQQKQAKPQRLLEFARICRVERILRPYLEAMA
jgi:predicted transcriptional regulator of viral defense system